MLATKLIIIVLNIFALVNGIDQHDQLTNGLDRPVRSDLDVYLRSLHSLVMFYTKEKNNIDANVALGLFLVCVNLKKSIQYNKNVLTPSLSENIDLLIKNSNLLLEYFHDMILSDERYKDAATAVSLFKDQDYWVSQMPTFNSQYVTPKTYSYKNLVGKFSSWKSYESRVIHYPKDKTSRPQPKESDACLMELGEIPVQTTLQNCDLSDDCIDIITNGTDYGYALTHRALILLCARYARNCNVLSKEEDKMMLKKFCDISYSEAVFISMNNYGILIDLLMEQMLLCLLDNHVQFLRRSWFSAVLKYENPAGCFELPGNFSNNDEFTQKNSLILRQQFEPPGDWYVPDSWSKSLRTPKKVGKCNDHLTAVTAAALSAGVKYILETYYS